MNKAEGAVIIHLERATARRPQVEQLRATLPMPSEVLPAVDGASAGADVLGAYHSGLGLRPRYPFPLLASEIACFLSHRAAWARIVENGWQAGLVLEDDAGLSPDVFAQALALAEASPGDGIVQFQTREVRARTVIGDGQVILMQPVLPPLRATCNYYTAAACRRLLSATEQFDRPVDVFLQMHWVTGLWPRVLWHSGVSEHSADIGGTTIQRKDRAALDRLRQEVRRPVFRAAMKMRAIRG